MNKQEQLPVGCSQNSVAKVLRRAEALKLSYLLPKGIMDYQFAALFNPSSSVKLVYKMLDYVYTAMEMMKDGVKLNLLQLE